MGVGVHEGGGAGEVQGHGWLQSKVMAVSGYELLFRRTAALARWQSKEGIATKLADLS